MNQGYNHIIKCILIERFFFAKKCKKVLPWLLPSLLWNNEYLGAQFTKPVFETLQGTNFLPQNSRQIFCCKSASVEKKEVQYDFFFCLLHPLLEFSLWDWSINLHEKVSTSNFFDEFVNVQKGPMRNMQLWLIIFHYYFFSRSIC